MPTVVQIIAGPEIGGQEILLKEILLNRKSRKIKHILIVLHTLNNDYLRSLVESGVNVFILRIPYVKFVWLRVILYFWCIGKIYRIVRDKPCIIHTHNFLYSALPLFVLCYFVSTVKHVHTVHTGGIHYQDSNIGARLKRRIEQFLYKLNETELIAVSFGVAQRLRKLFPGTNITAIPNGIVPSHDVRCFNDLSVISINEVKEKQFRGVYVGRLVKGKNHSTIIFAVSELKRRRYKVHVDFFGVGPLRSVLVDLANRCGVEEMISFHGHVDNVRTRLHLYDFGVFPSEYEGFSLALLELLNAGLPTAVSDVVTIREMGFCGDEVLWFSTFDHVELAECVEYFLNKDFETKELSLRGLRFSQKFDLNLSIMKIEQFYLNVGL